MLPFLLPAAYCCLLLLAACCLNNAYALCWLALLNLKVQL